MLGIYARICSLEHSSIGPLVFAANTKKKVCGIEVRIALIDAIKSNGISNNLNLSPCTYLENQILQNQCCEMPRNQTKKTG